MKTKRIAYLGQTFDSSNPNVVCNLCYSEEYNFPNSLYRNILSSILLPTLFPETISIPYNYSTYIPYLDYTDEGKLCLKFSKEKYYVFNLWSYKVDEWNFDNMYKEVNDDSIIFINDELIDNINNAKEMLKVLWNYEKDSAEYQEKIKEYIVFLKTFLFDDFGTGYFEN